MAKFKFQKSELNERCWLDTSAAVVLGYTYKGHRVFVVCAKTKAEARESMAAFIERSCV
ncbi:baseplate wedge initiator [Salmonella phage 40]|nr:baseplate wedge initiator [Salmonella phage 40]